MSEHGNASHREGVKYAKNAEVYDAAEMGAEDRAPHQVYTAERMEADTERAEALNDRSPIDLPPNPKKIFGASKPDLSLVPPVSIAHTAMAFEDGGYKYGPYNWRESAVEARTYIAAAKRHMNDFLDGTDYAGDSEVHNLGHVMACCAILLDAQENGNLIDDRPLPGASARVHDALKAKKASFKERAMKQWSKGSVMEVLADRAREKLRKLIG